LLSQGNRKQILVGKQILPGKVIMYNLEKLNKQIGSFCGVSDSQVNKALMILKQKEVDEQIRSNKVIEGVLNDIYGGVDRIASNLDDINIREEMIWTINKGDIMEDKDKNKVGDAHAIDKGMAIPFAPVTKTMTEQLADVFDILASDNEQLARIANHIQQVYEAMSSTMDQVTQIQARLSTAAETIATIAGAEEPQAAQPEPFTHFKEVDYGKLALCGCMGNIRQPIPARANDPLTNSLDDVTCPDCLVIISGGKKS